MAWGKKFDADMIRKIADEMEQRRESERNNSTQVLSAVNSRAAALYTAQPAETEHGDQTIGRIADKVVGGGAIAFCGFGGGFARLLLDLHNPAIDIFAGGIALGAVAAGGSILWGMYNPLRMVSDLWEFRQVRKSGEWREFEAWRMEQEYGKAPESKQVIETHIHDGSKTNILKFEGEQRDRAVEFAQIWLIEQSAAERHYVGGGKPWPNSDAGRQDWDEFKRATIAAGLGVDMGGGRWKIIRPSVMRKWAAVEVEK